MADPAVKKALPSASIGVVDLRLQRTEHKELLPASANPGFDRQSRRTSVLERQTRGLTIAIAEVAWLIKARIPSDAQAETPLSKMLRAANESVAVQQQ